MSALDSYRVVSEVRHRLALGLNYRDAANGAVLLADLDATIEAIDNRAVRLPMTAKPGGAAIVLTRAVAARFHGAANSPAHTLVRITPRVWPAAPRPRNRAVLPRRVLFDIGRNADGVPMAEAPNHAGQWVFDVPLFRGAASAAAGATVVIGQVVYPGPANALAEPVRWAHVVARRDGSADLLGVARADDRGEFALLVVGRAGQTPNAISQLEIRLELWGPPQRPDPLALAADAFADLPLEPWPFPAAGPLPFGWTPPAGYVAAAQQPAPLAAPPGRVTAAGRLEFTP